MISFGLPGNRRYVEGKGYVDSLYNLTGCKLTRKQSGKLTFGAGQVRNTIISSMLVAINFLCLGLRRPIERASFVGFYRLHETMPVTSSLPVNSNINSSPPRKE